MNTTTIAPRGRTSRLAYATLAAVLLAGIATDAITHSSYWQIAVFGVGPDLALLYGGGRDLAKGQLHPRAVPAYNLVHRFGSARFGRPRGPRTHPEPLADRRPDVVVSHRAGPLARLRTSDSRWLPAPLPRNRQRWPRTPRRSWHRGVRERRGTWASARPLSANSCRQRTLQAAIISTGYEEQAAFSEAALDDSEGPIGALAQAYGYRAS
jgi:hypothetical protein